MCLLDFTIFCRIKHFLYPFVDGAIPELYTVYKINGLWMKCDDDCGWF